MDSQRTDAPCVAIVGQGPSAEGYGDVIDGADIVIRMKMFWEHGALDTGHRLNVMIHNGQGLIANAKLCLASLPFDDWPDLHTCEHWFTRINAAVPSRVFHSFMAGFNMVAAGHATEMLTDELWCQLRDNTRFKSRPSTGLCTVGMAMKHLKPSTLMLFGFDSTHPTAPNYWDARPHAKVETLFPHDMCGEKQLIAEIFNKRWLGQECRTRLIWPEQPKC